MSSYAIEVGPNDVLMPYLVTIARASFVACSQRTVAHQPMQVISRYNFTIMILSYGITAEQPSETPQASCATGQNNKDTPDTSLILQGDWGLGRQDSKLRHGGSCCRLTHVCMQRHTAAPMHCNAEPACPVMSCPPT